MSPPQFDGLLWRLAGEQPEDEPRREAVATTNAIVDVQLASRRSDCVPVDPGNSAPVVAVSGVDLAECGGDDLDPGISLNDLSDAGQETGRVEFGTRGHLWSGNSKSLLQIFFVANQHVDVFNNGAQHLLGAFDSADRTPEFFAVVLVERYHRTRSTSGAHRLNH